jgi:hypothetical protein
MEAPRLISLIERVISFQDTIASLRGLRFRGQACREVADYDWRDRHGRRAGLVYSSNLAFTSGWTMTRILCG